MGKQRLGVRWEGVPVFILDGGSEQEKGLGEF